ncbi:MAG: hypothetical protein IT372_19080 [Polyangiaceae bacterium]|nr:hypothetical protein [Polyangiaceae bacterium]
MYAGACVLYAAAEFYGAMHAQTGGVWSAPLDDVFIHFDYARATARGFPFQWSEGNGFSSGNTSLSYPVALALGYLVGFRGLLLMQWAAILACASVLGFLIVGGRMLERVGRWAKYLLPPVALSIGALDWSLFSGMENAFHLGVWAISSSVSLGLAEAAGRGDPPEALARRAWLAGAAGALLYATRPESVVCVAALGVYAALAVRRARGGRAAIGALLRAGAPGVIAVVAQAAANRALTGEWAANGAIAKLALNNPYMTAGEKWDNYAFLLRYVIARNTEHHFADVPPWGYLLPAAALLPFAARETRGLAAALWVQVAGWLALVALNGQVRWQNERYTMPAVAWLLLLAAMGLAVLVRGPRGEGRAARALHAARVALAAAAAALFWHHQRPNMRDQIWFFARASRNIRDQHLVAGKILKELGVRRILVGDAGALLYAADRPGLDLIGLGGYHDLPFARAGVHGLGASLELIERIPPAERPDVMAIYPGWWGSLPDIFGKRLVSVPVVGNVICGGAEKVIYRADWDPLERRSVPAALAAGERIADELDVADLVSERAHGYSFPRPQAGFVDFSVLPRPDDRERELFDAGRVIPAGRAETARVRAPRGAGRLVVRTVASHPATIEARAGDEVLGRLEIRAGKGWTEASMDLRAGLPESFELTLTPVEGTWIDHHVWIGEAAPDGTERSRGD